jgi:polyisoprenoid-binding protein YceI
MKKMNISIAAAALAVALSFAFTIPGDKNTTYTVDTKKSTVVWLGKKVTGEHTGNISLNSGKVEVADKTIKSAEFEMDMNSITCTDLTDATYNGKLIGHLKSEDFFNTAKYPTATFVLKSATDKGNSNYEVKGDLTIKGITKEVSFPSVIKMEGKTFVAVSTITIDRTKYDIKYGSKSFFEGIGDKAINDEFELKVNLVAQTK